LRVRACPADTVPDVNIPQPEQELFDDGEALDPRKIASMQLRALNRAIARAAALPFYQRVFSEAGYGACRVDSFEEYARVIPSIRKTDIANAIRSGGSAWTGMEAMGRHRLTNVVMTSGTLGFNTFAFLTRADLMGGSLRNGLRELWSMKVRPGMRVLSLSPAWHALALLDTRAISAIGAELVVPWGTFAPRFVPNFVDAVRRHRPEHLILTAPVLRGIIDECDRLADGARETFASVRYVACAGESLSPTFRQYVIDRLGLADLYERGGSSDGMFGGGECFAHRGHHISADLQYIEIVDPRTGALQPAGQRGTVLVTNLRGNRSVYVRFNSEDVAEIVPGRCPCGRTDPVIELYGRLSDSVVLEDRIVAPADIRAALDEFPEFMARPFSVERVDGAGVRVKIASGAGQPELRRAETALRDALGINVSVNVDDSTAIGWKGQPGRGT
jgi:phenylacetate-CoA ligase